MVRTGAPPVRTEVPPRDPFSGRTRGRSSNRHFEGLPEEVEALDDGQLKGEIDGRPWTLAAQVRARREKRDREILGHQDVLTSDAAYIGQVVEHEGAYVWVDLLDDDGEHELVRFDVTNFPAQLRAAIVAGEPFRGVPSPGVETSRVVFELIGARDLTETEQTERESQAATLLRSLRRPGA